MFSIIDFSKKKEWDELVKNIPDYDVYYLNGYVAAFRVHGDGEPILISYQDGCVRGICVFMLRDISEEQWAKELPRRKYFDAITPYGYGGWLFNKNPSNIDEFWRAYSRFMLENSIICAFTRWSPWLRNHEVLRSYSNVIDLGKTICMDTSSKGIILDNIKSKDRNVIRKAIKNGVEVKYSTDPQKMREFIKLYNSTMDRDCALNYYYFDESFYNSIENDLKGHWQLFYAELNGQTIAASIILFCNGRMHYHLSGSAYEYRNLNPTNLILYTAALYGASHGFKILHLGGGVGSRQDALYNFKKSFNKKLDGRLQFCISKDCFDEAAYKYIVGLRSQNDANFNASSSFFPVYREE